MNLIELPQNSTINEMMAIAAEHWNKTWTSSYEYTTENYRQYTGAEIKVTEPLARVVLYLTEMLNWFWNRNSVDIPKLARQELAHWDNQGGLCIYLSVLCYCLLSLSGVTEKNIHLVQGVYKHEARTDLPYASLFGKVQQGLHAFVYYYKSVVDIGIMTEESFFDFKGSNIILGEVPDGMELYGWAENLQTIKDYARVIARESGMVYSDWAREHNRLSAVMFREYLKNRARK